MDILDRLYAAVDDDAALAALPQLIADTVGARSAMLQHIGADGAMRSATFNYWAPEHLSRYVEGKYYLDDPWLPYASAPHAINRVYAFDELVPLRTVLNSRFFDFYRSIGDDTAHVVGGVIALEDGMLTLGALAGLGSNGFDAGHAARLQPLVPHLRRLYELRARLARGRPAPSLADGVIDGLDCGVLIVDQNGRILFLNRLAKAILDRADGLASRAGTLRVKSGGDRRLVWAMAIAASRRDAGFDAFEVARSDGASYRIAVSPWSFLGSSCALITIDDPKADQSPAADLAARLYGLTSAETAVLKALLKGLSPEEAAEQRAVSLATVRTQVQHLLRKTDTRRISEMLVLVARLARVASSPAPLERDEVSRQAG